MMRKTNVLAAFDEPVNEFPDEQIIGIYQFGKKSVIVKDMELAKMILIKDADHFTDRLRIDVKGSRKEGDLIFDNMLTQLTGEKWKQARSMVSPVFTSGKLKLMIPHMNKCAENLDQMFIDAAVKGEVLEAKEIYGK